MAQISKGLANNMIMDGPSKAWGVGTNKIVRTTFLFCKHGDIMMLLFSCTHGRLKEGGRGGGLGGGTMPPSHFANKMIRTSFPERKPGDDIMLFCCKHGWPLQSGGCGADHAPCVGSKNKSSFVGLAQLHVVHRPLEGSALGELLAAGSARDFAVVYLQPCQAHRATERQHEPE